MREILFRGKLVNNVAWVIGDLIQRKNGKNFINSGTSTQSYEVDPATVSQYIGLTDKNGKKIFEGDVIRYKDGRSFVSGVVKFGSYADPARRDKGHMGFYLDWIGNDILRNDIVFWTSQRLVEIIDNIHDNPELLGGETDG